MGGCPHTKFPSENHSLIETLAILLDSAVTIAFQHPPVEHNALRTLQLQTSACKLSKKSRRRWSRADPEPSVCEVKKAMQNICVSLTTVMHMQQIALGCDMTDTSLYLVYLGWPIAHLCSFPLPVGSGKNVWMYRYKGGTFRVEWEC